jgi:hypothetical protein
MEKSKFKVGDRVKKVGEDFRIGHRLKLNQTGIIVSEPRLIPYNMSCEVWVYRVEKVEGDEHEYFEYELETSENALQRLKRRYGKKV